MLAACWERSRALRKHSDAQVVRLVLVGAQHLGPQHRLVQAELTVSSDTVAGSAFTSMTA